MLISSRRLKYLAVGMLALLAAVVFQPSRQRLAQTCLRKLIDPTISIQNLTIHPRSSVWMVDGVQWSRHHGDRTLEFDAARAWIVQRPEPLLDGQISIAGIQFKDCMLTMKPDSPRPRATPNEWQAKLLQPTIRLDTAQIKAGLGSLATAELVNQKWSQRIEAWIEDSHSIASAVEEISAGISLDANPLRNEAGLLQALADVDRLIEQQRHLLSQFDGVRKLLLAESKQLRESFASELSALDVASSEVESPSTKQLLESLMFELALGSWVDLSPYAEVAHAIDELLHQGHQRPNYDRDFFPNGKCVELLSLDKIASEGVFRYEQFAVPFSLRGCYSTHSPAMQPITHQSQLHLQFAQPGIMATVSVEKESDGLNSHLVQLKAYASRGSVETSPSDASRPRHASPSDASPSDASPSDASPSDASESHASRAIACTDTVPDGEPIVAFRLHATHATIDGTLQLSAANVQLTRETTSWIREAVEGLDSQGTQFEVKVEGSWSEPRFEFLGNAPEQLIAAMNNLSNADAGSAEVLITPGIREEFAHELDQISALVVLAANESSSIVEAHGQKLEQVRHALQVRLNEITGASFARRPGSVSNR